MKRPPGRERFPGRRRSVGGVWALRLFRGQRLCSGQGFLGGIAPSGRSGRDCRTWCGIVLFVLLLRSCLLSWISGRRSDGSPGTENASRASASGYALCGEPSATSSAKTFIGRISVLYFDLCLFPDRFEERRRVAS